MKQIRWISPAENQTPKKSLSRPTKQKVKANKPTKPTNTLSQNSWRRDRLLLERVSELFFVFLILVLFGTHQFTRAAAKTDIYTYLKTTTKTPFTQVQTTTNKRIAAVSCSVDLVIWFVLLVSVFSFAFYLPVLTCNSYCLPTCALPICELVMGVLLLSLYVSIRLFISSHFLYQFKILCQRISLKRWPFARFIHSHGRCLTGRPPILATEIGEA